MTTFVEIQTRKQQDMIAEAEQRQAEALALTPEVTQLEVDSAATAATDLSAEDLAERAQLAWRDV